jgi:hypothetical protein
MSMPRSMRSHIKLHQMWLPDGLSYRSYSLWPVWATGLKRAQGGDRPTFHGAPTADIRFTARTGDSRMWKSPPKRIGVVSLRDVSRKEPSWNQFHASQGVAIARPA